MLPKFFLCWFSHSFMKGRTNGHWKRFLCLDCSQYHALTADELQDDLGENSTLNIHYTWMISLNVCAYVCFVCWIHVWLINYGTLDDLVSSWHVSAPELVWSLVPQALARYPAIAKGSPRGKSHLCKARAFPPKKRARLAPPTHGFRVYNRSLDYIHSLTGRRCTDFFGLALIALSGARSLEHSFHCRVVSIHCHLVSIQISMKVLHGPHDFKGLQLGNSIPLLLWGQRSASIGNRVQPVVILSLGLYCSQSSYTGIGLQSKWLVEVWVDEDRGFN